jgi:hypothetical protein
MIVNELKLMIDPFKVQWESSYTLITSLLSCLGLLTVSSIDHKLNNTYFIRQRSRSVTAGKLQIDAGHGIGLGRHTLRALS